VQKILDGGVLFNDECPLQLLFETDTQGAQLRSFSINICMGSASVLACHLLCLFLLDNGFLELLQRPGKRCDAVALSLARLLVGIFRFNATFTFTDTRLKDFYFECLQETLDCATGRPSPLQCLHLLEHLCKDSLISTILKEYNLKAAHASRLTQAEIKAVVFLYSRGSEVRDVVRQAWEQATPLQSQIPLDLIGLLADGLLLKSKVSDTFVTQCFICSIGKVYLFNFLIYN
jgi:hypothetical protein